MAKILCTVAILTFNSGTTLRRALESVRDFDDILVCDGGSTDETLSIAAEFGARVITQDSSFRDASGRLIDYGGVRNQCLNAAHYDWFLYIDSDESISKGLHDDIARIAQENTEPYVYRVPIGIMIDSMFVKYSSNYPGYQFRFFNRKSAVHFIKPVHERIDFNPKSPNAGTLTHPWLIHTTRDEWRHYLTEGRRYRDIAVAKFRSAPWGQVLRTVLRNIYSSLGVFLRAGGIYLVRGTREAIPVEGEIGRLLDPLILSARIVWAKLNRTDTVQNSTRIAYISYTRMPTERAHGLQIMETCAALVREGKEVELIVPARRNPLRGTDPFVYYRLSERFPITYLETPDLLSWGPLGYLISIWWFARTARSHLKRHTAGVVFSRDERVLSHLLWHPRVVWESHTGAWNDAARRVTTAAHRIVVISRGLKQFYQEHDVPEERIVVAPDGVDLDAFATLPSKYDARARLGLAQEKPVAMYVGKLDGWKGVGTFLEASALTDASCVVIGGEEKELPVLKRRYPQVIFLGPRPYAELPLNLAAADVLILPNTGKDEISVRFTSPLKLFAYMASGRPIVASNLPSLCEVISEDMAYLVKPDDPKALAEGIQEALAHPEDASLRAVRAKAEVVRYSWDARAQAILKA